MIKLIIFDLWYTLAQREAYHLSATRELEKEFNINRPHEEVVKIFEQIIQTKIWETEFDAYWELLKELKINPSKVNIMKAIAIRGKAETHIALYDFTVPLLTQLREKGIKIGLLTNSSVFIREIVEKDTPLMQYIDYPIFSYEIGTIKPDPVLFLEMQRQSEVADSKEIIMIGDNMFDDIYPAQKLGINTIHFTGDYKQLKKELKKFDIIIK
ncbi:MAG: HAD family hydrolase [archaeon]|jgi:putative hydrolase of the HAD superfamily